MSDCPKGFWNPIALKPIPSLAALRKVVTEHNEKRMPKWKFRLASDLIVQIQLQLTATFRDFACRAIECPGADEKVFAPRAERRPDQTNLKFDIYSDIPNHWARLNYTGFVPGQWVFKPTRIGWARDGTPNFGLAARLVQVLNDGRFDRIKPAMLLSPHCLNCGKKLTDPGSMARLVGPECARTSSLIVPWAWQALGQVITD
jgi:hypothetical protein